MASASYGDRKAPPLPARRGFAVSNYSNISASDQARQHNGDVINNTVNHYSHQGDSDNQDDISALWQAAANGHTDRVKHLVEGRRVRIDQQDQNGLTALHHACLSGFHDTVRYLISAGAPVNSASEMYGTPLCLAVLKERHSITRLLLESRVDPNASGGYLGSALHAACYIGSMSLTQSLLRAGAQSQLPRMFLWSEVEQLRGSGQKQQHEQEDFDELRPADIAYRRGFNDIVGVLQEPSRAHHPPPNLDAPLGRDRPDGLSPLARAAAAGDLVAVMGLVESGVDVGPVRDISRDPIVMAAGSVNSNIMVIQTLVHARGQRMKDEVFVAALNAARDCDMLQTVTYLENLRFVTTGKDDTGRHVKPADHWYARYL